jgi:hypothetical protein
MTAPLDWRRKSLRAEQSDRSEDAEALRVWEEEGGTAQAVTAGSRRGRRTRDAASSQLDGVRCPHPAVVDPGSSS